MPSAMVIDLMARVLKLEKKVAVLLSWHKIQVGMLVALIAMCLRLLWK
jgi:hypothetical protein